jgi:hypothetical protein
MDLIVRAAPAASSVAFDELRTGMTGAMRRLS